MLREYLKSIADAIREGLEMASSVKINAQYFPEMIRSIYAKGQSHGYEEGKQAEYDEFWDNYQDNGNRGSYEAAFWGSGWNDSTFKPKYTFYPISLNQAFRSSCITDLVVALETQNVTIDTSRCTSFNYTFAVYSAFTHIGVLDTKSASELPYTFSTATALHTIDELILKDDGSQKFNNTFGSCNKLTNIKITGCIGQNFDIKSSPLSKESIESILNALSTETTGTTLSLKKTAVQTVFETTDLDSSTGWTTLKNSKNNWTITLM